MMKGNIQKLGTVSLVIAFVAVFIWWNAQSDLEHIPDTNGADDFTLEKITDENIVKLDLGSIGGPGIYDNIIGETQTYYANKFTGVVEIYGENLITNCFQITVNHAAVDAGNFRMVLLVDDEIVHDFTLNELTQTFVLENVSGYVSLRIAGESASFNFDYYII